MNDPEQFRKDNPEHVEALDYISSPRGFFLLSQALYIAVRALQRLPLRDQPASNIEDMHFLRKYLFNIPGELLDPLAWKGINTAAFYENCKEISNTYKDADEFYDYIMNNPAMAEILEFDNEEWDEQTAARALNTFNDIMEMKRSYENGDK